jgi:hypothetical protein
MPAEEKQPPTTEPKTPAKPSDSTPLPEPKTPAAPKVTTWPAPTTPGWAEKAERPPSTRERKGS